MKLNQSTKFVDSNMKPIKIGLRKVSCADLRNYKDAIIDIVMTGDSKEFGKGNEKFSYTTLTAIQIKIKEINSVFNCDFQ